jgi:hypothetical protein
VLLRDRSCASPFCSALCAVCSALSLENSSRSAWHDHGALCGVQPEFDISEMRHSGPKQREMLLSRPCKCCRCGVTAMCLDAHLVVQSRHWHPSHVHVARLYRVQISSINVTLGMRSVNTHARTGMPTLQSMQWHHARSMMTYRKTLDVKHSVER